MNTTTKAPEMTEDIKQFIADLNAYNEEVSRLNTCYGGATQFVTTYGAYGKDVTESMLEAIAKNDEFTKLRQAQIAKVEELASIVRFHVEGGCAKRYRAYEVELDRFYQEQKTN